jgi:ribosomal protein L29
MIKLIDKQPESIKEMESFFATLKQELVDLRQYQTKQDAKQLHL